MHAGDDDEAESNPNRSRQGPLKTTNKHTSGSFSSSEKVTRMRLCKANKRRGRGTLLAYQSMLYSPTRVASFGIARRYRICASYFLLRASSFVLLATCFLLPCNPAAQPRMQGAGATHRLSQSMSSFWWQRSNSRVMSTKPYSPALMRFSCQDQPIPLGVM